jgi:hypothetical protein
MTVPRPSLFTIGILIWFGFVLSSLLYPPESGSMRPREKALMVLSAVLALVWMVILLLPAPL